MRINGAKFKAAAAAKGATIESLAQALAEQTNLKGARAQSAVTNWMNDRDHPRCKREHLLALAGALGVPAAEIARFECVFKYHRGSPRKAKLLVDLIRNKRVDVAEQLLTFTTKRAALDILKALKAAKNDADQADAKSDTLVVSVSRVGDAPRMKRFQPKDRGRAHPILKRMTHITIGLEERK